MTADGFYSFLTLYLYSWTLSSIQLSFDWLFLTNRGFKQQLTGASDLMRNMKAVRYHTNTKTD